MRISLLVNSDIGIPNTVGFRATQVAKQLIAHSMLEKVVCRDYRKGSIPQEYIKTLYPPNGKIGKLFPQSLTYLGIHCRPLEHTANQLRSQLFALAARKVPPSPIVHTWDFSQTITKKLQEKNSIVIQDVPIAINTITKDFHKNDETYPVPIPDMTTIRACRQANYVVAPSPFVRDSLINEGVSEQKISIVPYGVDSNRFTPNEKKNKKFTVAFSGNITIRKGITYLINAWQRFHKKYPKSQLILYGRLYPEYNHIRDVNGIVLPGFVDVAQELPKADVFCFPTCLEGSSKAIYEAMASGLPVITTYNAGSIITHSKDGFIIPPQDEQAIYDYFELLYTKEKLRTSIGKQARKTVQKYTWEHYAKNILEVYNHVWHNRNS